MASSDAAVAPAPVGGARWRYVWGSTLMFTFLVQMVTGFFLWAAYAPSSQTAWESVYYIQHEMSFGWLLRGIHHYTAQMMIVLLALLFFAAAVWLARGRRETLRNVGVALLLVGILLFVVRRGAGSYIVDVSRHHGSASLRLRRFRRTVPCMRRNSGSTYRWVL